MSLSKYPNFTLCAKAYEADNFSSKLLPFFNDEIQLIVSDPWKCMFLDPKYLPQTY